MVVVTHSSYAGLVSQLRILAGSEVVGLQIAGEDIVVDVMVQGMVTGGTVVDVMVQGMVTGGTLVTEVSLQGSILTV